MYYGIANQSSPAYFYPYLSNFLSFHTMIHIMITVKDFFTTMQAREGTSGMQIVDDVLYCEMENQSFPVDFPMFLMFFHYFE